MRIRIFVCVCFALITSSFAVVLPQDEQHTESVQLNYDLGLERLIELGGYDNADSYINSKNFPPPKTGFDEVEAALVYFTDGNPVTTESVHEWAKSRQAEGWRLANVYELLAFGAKRPDVQRKRPLVALGSAAIDEYGVSSVAYLWGDENERTLNRGWTKSDWHPICCFLVVRAASVEGGILCDECRKLIYAAALWPFVCVNCGHDKIGANGGSWHYCDNCAKKLSRCTMCGKKM